MPTSSRLTGRRFSPLRPPADLMDRERAAPDSFAACLDAHGKYQTEQFVLRLSPRNHQLMDAINAGAYADGDMPDEAILAYAIYLHETVHWWQHVGSTAGLLYSLAYPAQFHANLDQLKTVAQVVGPKKSLLQWAERQAVNGTPPTDPALQQANIAVNNALDVDFYKLFTSQPLRSDELYATRYFDSVGHSYYMAYGQLIGLLSESMDDQGEHLPSMESWDASMAKVREAKVINYYHGSQIIRSRVGLHALFEGQARFIQLQLLSSSSDPHPSCEDWRAAGYLSGVYVEAFGEFLRLSESTWPATISDPLVGLFLLICDIAINPTRGFPHPVEQFEHLVEDVDPGMRFTNLSMAVKRLPGVRNAILTYSREEYIETAGLLTAACGYDHPLFGARKVALWPDVAPGASKLMQEHATFEYNPVNQPVRVLFSHFISFAKDKLAYPEFFCWPGVWMVGDRASDNVRRLFTTHLSLFTDKAEGDGVFPRRQPGRQDEAVQQTFNTFYAQTLIYDLTRQWILQDGPFRFDYGWLTTRVADATEIWACNAFESLFGIQPRDFTSTF